MLQAFKLSLVMLLLIPSLVLANEIVLKSGQKLEGKIVEQTDKYVKLDYGVGVITTYYSDEIDAIDGQRVQTKELIKTTKKIDNNGHFDKLSNNYVIKDEEKKEFAEVFTDFLNVSKNLAKNGETSEVSKSWAALNKFRAKYSETALANDALYVPLLFKFVGAVTGKDKITEEQEMEGISKFVQSHPDGAVNPLTKGIWSNVLGKQSSWVLYIPNDLVLDYIRGFAAMNSQDYAKCIEYYSVLKDHLNFYNENREEIKELVNEVYAGLAVSYLLLHKNDNLKVLAKEANEKFPDDIELKDRFQKILN